MSREAFAICMDQRVASQPTLMRGCALLIEGLTRVPLCSLKVSLMSRTRSVACRSPKVSMGCLNGCLVWTQTSGLEPLPTHCLHPRWRQCSPTPPIKDAWRTHGPENCRHDSICQGRFVSLTPSSPVAQPLRAHDRCSGWTALPPLEGRQSGKTPEGAVARTSHGCSQRAELRWQGVGVLACSWRVWHARSLVGRRSP